MRFVLILEENRYVTDKGRFPYLDTSKSLIFNFKSLHLLINRLFQLKFIANEATELRSEVASAAEL